MAITNSDGSIVLTTRIEDAGLKKGMAKIISDQKTQLQSLTREYAKLITNNKQNTEEAKKLKDQIDKLSKSIKENESVLQSFEKKSTGAFSRVGSALKSIAGYLALAFSVTKIIQFSNEAGQLATQTEASVQRLVDIYGSASDSVGDFIDQNARALGMSKAAAASFSSVYGNLFSVWADQETNAQLTNEYLRMTAVVASKTGRTVEDVQERVRSGLLGNTEAIEDLGIFVNVKTIEMTDAFQRMANGKSWEQLDAYTQQQIRSMAILEQATAKYGDEVADTSATIRNRYKTAYEDFKNSWGTIVNQVLLPVLQTLTQIFNIATAGLNALSGRSGKILEDAEGLNDNSEDTAENIEEQTKNQKELNKELKKSLAGFDDIQILSSQTADNTGGGGLDSGLQGIGGDLGETAPDGSAYVEEANETLMGIMGIVATALVAVGLILLFTGHIGWGIGFIIAGAATLTVTMASASEFGYDGIIQMLTIIMGVAGGALLALGIILVYFKILPTGIGMIVAGASLIVSSVAMQGTFNPDDIASWLSIIMGIAGGALLAIGIFLCYMKVYPQGIGLIIAGATSLISAVALGSEDITEKIKGWVAVIMAIAGGALLALGIILCATQVGIATGISLIAAGAVALVTPIALNWNYIVEQMRGTFGKIMAIVSGALLVLGILLCFVPGAQGIALGLILAGVAGLATVVAFNWDSIVDWVKGAWDAVKAFWNKYIAPVFTAKFWLDLAKACGNGLIAGFEGAINGIIYAFESMINWIVDGLNKISIKIPKWVPGIGGETWGVNIPRATLGRVSIPRLAQGAVIPPNKEFLAVLGDQKKGTNIETPLSTMVDAFNMALNSRGSETVKEEHYYLDESEIMRIIYKLAKKGEQAQGADLIESW